MDDADTFGGMGDMIRIQAVAGDTDTYLAPARPSPGGPVLLLHPFYSGIFEAPTGVAYLGHFAEHDDFEDSAQVPDLDNTLNEGSAAYVYPGTKHWFVEADRPEYDADASDLAYGRTVACLREQLA